MKRLVALLVLFAVLVGGVYAAPEVPVATADVTEQVVTVVPTEVSTAEAPADVEIDVDVSGEEEAPADPAEPWWAKYLVQLLIAGGLLVSGLAGLNMWLKSKVDNRPFMDSVEYGYRALTPDAAEEKIDAVMIGLAKELEEFGGNAAKFLRLLGNKGDVIAQKVDAAKQAQPKTES